MLNSMLALSVTQNASDLHLSSGEAPFIRINGQLQLLNADKLIPNTLEMALLSLLNESQRKILQQHKQIDFAYHLDKVGRFRVNIFYQHRGISAVFRVINHRIPTLSDIDAPAIFSDLVKNDSGIILVTGATGSGKSTTLATLIQ
ncbi:ATPase, T2SS/T4P/T4SS family, partial [Gilliamella apicola]|uniref:ATPase, T2SS/T4P/T4SS family n=1 Tax=Gilliamella apicola TaxID=1196095 RepID=UPI002FEE4F37